MRTPNAMTDDAMTHYLFGATINSVSQVQFWASKTQYYSGDNWLAIGT